MQPSGPTGPPPGSKWGPRPKVEKLTAAGDARAYGTVIPVVHGEGTADGVLAWGNAGIRWTSGWEIGLDDAGQPTVKRASVYASAGAYIFAQGVITHWLWIQRGGVTFGPGQALAFNNLVEMDGFGDPVEPETTAGDPTTAIEWPYAVALGPASRAPLGHLAVFRSPGVILPDCRFPTDLTARLVGSFGTFIALSSWTGRESGFYAAEPADMLRDIVENPITGFGMTGLVETEYGPNRQTESSFDAYMAARSWHLARVWADENPGTDALQEIGDATDSVFLWTGSKLKVIPLCETEIIRDFGGVTYTYTPPTTAIAFTDDDFVLEDANTDPIEATRTPDSNIPTVVPVEYLPYTSADGTTTTTESMDAAASTIRGVVRSDPISLQCIAFDEHAKAISQIRAQRGIHNRTQYRWRSSWRFIGVEPGDLATLTHVMMGLDEQLVRITSVEETDDGLAFDAVEWHSGVSVVAVGMPQTSDGIGYNPMVPPDMAGSLASIADDAVFSAAEHAAALMAWNDLNGSKGDLVAKAAIAGVSSTAWVAAWQALGTYLNAGTTYTTGVPAWLVAPYEDTAIVPATWESTWAAAYATRGELLNATTAAKTKTTYSVTAPLYPNAGDQWYDTDDGNKLYVWSGTAWVQGPVGPPGPTGPGGGTGAAGARGSIHFYANKSSDGPGEIWTAGSPWEDACANYYLPAGGPIFMDQCTQFTGDWAETRYWDSGWVLVTAVIDGNLLVTGSVAADKIVANSLQTSDYASTGSGASEVATVGARLRNGGSTSSGTVPAIITSPAGIKIGRTVLSESWLTRLEHFSFRLYWDNPYWVAIIGGYIASGTGLSTSVATINGVNGIVVELPSNFLADLLSASKSVLVTATQDGWNGGARYALWFSHRSGTNLCFNVVDEATHTVVSASGFGSSAHPSWHVFVDGYATSGEGRL